MCKVQIQMVLLVGVRCWALVPHNYLPTDYGNYTFWGGGGGGMYLAIHMPFGICSCVLVCRISLAGDSGTKSSNSWRLLEQSTVLYPISRSVMLVCAFLACPGFSFSLFFSLPPIVRLHLLLYTPFIQSYEEVCLGPEEWDLLSSSPLHCP